MKTGALWVCVLVFAAPVVLAFSFDEPGSKQIILVRKSFNQTVNVTLTGLGNMTVWRLAAGNTQGSAEVVNDTLVNITGGTGITVTRDGTILEINQTGMFTTAIPAANVSQGDFGSGVGDSDGNYSFNGSVLFIDGTNDRVGIGTASPSEKLSVDGNISLNGTVTNRLLLPLNNDANTPTISFGDGNTGFYERSDNLLEFSANGVAKFQFGVTRISGFVSNSFAVLNTQAQSTVPNLIPRKGDTTIGIGGALGELAIIVGGVNAINVDSSQNITMDTNTLFVDAVNDRVGVGTSSPGVRLDVVGGDVSFDTDGFYFDDTTNRVGIGTATPNEQLEITGNFRLPTTVDSATGVIMKDGDRFIHDYADPTSAGFNVFVGNQAGNFIMGSGGGGEGSRNTGVGVVALNRLTTGASNAAIGQNAGGIITTGNNNMAVGEGSLSVLTTGSNNVGIGRRAGNIITTGSNNIMIGTSQNPPSATDTDKISIGGVITGDLTTGELAINDAGGDLDFRIEGDTEPNLLFVDASTNNIGIGTSSPTTDLEVVATVPVVKVRMTNVDAPGGYLWDNGVVEWSLSHQGNSSGNPLFFRDETAGKVLVSLYPNGNFSVNDSFFVDTSGRVGIGTANPTQRLSVEVDDIGGISLENTATGGVKWIMFAGDDDNTPQGALFFQNNDASKNIFTLRPDGPMGVGSTTPTFKGMFNIFNANNNSLPVLYMERSSGSEDYMQVTNSSGTPGDIFVINSDGNIGIGTSSPNATLHVVTSGTTPVSTSENKVAIFQNTGGGNSPASLFLVGGNATGNSQFVFCDGDGTGLDACFGRVVYFHQLDRMDFFVNNAAKMTIDSAGDVGIGTSSPNQLLHIEGGVFNSTGLVGNNTIMGDLTVLGTTFGGSPFKIAGGATISHAENEPGLQLVVSNGQSGGSAGSIIGIENDVGEFALIGVASSIPANTAGVNLLSMQAAESNFFAIFNNASGPMVFSNGNPESFVFRYTNTSDASFAMTTLMNLTPDGDLIVKDTIFTNTVYGGMFIQDESAIIIPLTLTDVYESVIGFDTLPLNRITFDGSNTLSPTVDGTYSVSYSITFANGANSVSGFAVAVNGVVQNGSHQHRRLSIGGDEQAIASAEPIIQMNAGDNVTLVVKDETNPASNPTIIQGSLIMKRLGGII